ncbi:HlyD family secretion protein [Massilia sp. TS11]|uniref:HlyD family secretion protein n=1 Tax=Massilia sp. TS11 TaxID=2908003 RepID=UPI001EDAD233|nr:efflux RND transporter periplasmic adaptor subunit [Massilia sp. TS11]MCG2586355.1 efflux RND transporter periplasmic adaptor subunit [Massilia sp. TS11]
MSFLTLRRWSALVILLVVGVAIFLLLRSQHQTSLPPGIALGNGRLEATEVDVATKVAGRLATVAVREGDAVVRDQVLASLDVADLQAQLRAAQAQVAQARAAVAESRAGVDSSNSQQKLASLTLGRTDQLVKRGFLSGDRLDRDQSALQTAESGAAAARSRLREAGEAVTAAEARVDALKVTIADAALKAPLAGRVLYRLAQPGEVIAAGGKVLTLLDLSDVFMSVYLPTSEAGKVALNSPARIVLDALPGQVIPARVVFVAPRSQFTPKEVETRNEREKFMFRVKVQVEPAWLAAHAELAKPGMPGVAYVLTVPNTPWPAALTPR